MVMKRKEVFFLVRGKKSSRRRMNSWQVTMLRVSSWKGKEEEGVRGGETSIDSGVTMAEVGVIEDHGGRRVFIDREKAYSGVGKGVGPLAENT